ncbi:MAG: response regulator transcription factor [Gammaproteobacteria bacterium]|nr:response regulator transcription factor [Gammaproteobacteria bacterium]
MRVLLIDDHTLFRVGLQGLLERMGIEVVASAGSGEEGLKIVSEKKPDVVLLDMRMPDMDGIEVLKSLREQGEEMPIAILTTVDDECDLIEALQCGAQGFLLKGMQPDELVTALQDIHDGKTVVAPDLTPILAKVVQGHAPSAPEPSPFSELTPRETEILFLLAEGQSNKVIARNLEISDGTVKLHVKAILRKLKIHSRVEAAVMAVQHGLLKKSEN